MFGVDFSYGLTEFQVWLLKHLGRPKICEAGAMSSRPAVEARTHPSGLRAFRVWNAAGA